MPPPYRFATHNVFESRLSIATAPTYVEATREVRSLAIVPSEASCLRPRYPEPTKAAFGSAAIPKTRSSGFWSFGFGSYATHLVGPTWTNSPLTSGHRSIRFAAKQGAAGQAGGGHSPGWS